MFANEIPFGIPNPDHNATPVEFLFFSFAAYIRLDKFSHGIATLDDDQITLPLLWIRLLVLLFLICVDTNFVEFEEF